MVLLCGMVVSPACSRFEGRGFKGCGVCAPARWRFPPLLRSQARILSKRGLERFLADGDPGLDGAAVLAALEQSL